VRVNSYGLGSRLDYQCRGRLRLVVAERESQREWVMGERAGGMMPRNWQRECRWSQWGAVRMWRRSEARRRSWKSNRPER
jgi:hypothetical protein